MMKEAVRALETGSIPEIGLIAFFVAFVLILIYAFALPRKRRDELKNLPLDDAPPSSGTPNSNHR